MSRTLIWERQGGLLPTAPGKAPGIISAKRDTGGLLLTIQCSACWATVTGYGILAVRAIDFSPDPGASGHLPYRRCEQCREARKHPNETTA